MKPFRKALADTCKTQASSIIFAESKKLETLKIGFISKIPTQSA